MKGIAMKPFKTVVLAATMLAAACAGYATRDAGAQAKKVETQRVFEMRTYYANPGKMQALHARFRNHTNKLFEKHGMTLIGFWSPLDAKEAEQKMVYILAYPSKEAAKKSWKAFRADPDWQAVVKESEKGGKLLAKPPESVYMNPTDYSPIK